MSSRDDFVYYFAIFLNDRGIVEGNCFASEKEAPVVICYPVQAKEEADPNLDEPNFTYY